MTPPATTRTPCPGEERNRYSRGYRQPPGRTHEPGAGPRYCSLLGRSRAAREALASRCRAHRPGGGRHPRHEERRRRASARRSRAPGRRWKARASGFDEAGHRKAPREAARCGPPARACARARHVLERARRLLDEGRRAGRSRSKSRRADTRDRCWCCARAQVAGERVYRFDGAAWLNSPPRSTTPCSDIPQDDMGSLGGDLRPPHRARPRRRRTPGSRRLRRERHLGSRRARPTPGPGLPEGSAPGGIRC